MNDGMKNYGKDDFKGVTHTWDLVQENLKCCGVDTWEDWKNVYNNNSVPDSCCKEGPVENCGKDISDPNKLWTKGCYVKFTDYFSHNLTYVGSKTTCPVSECAITSSL